MQNNKIRITKEFHFEMAHALHGYDGKCKNIHGHSYQLDVTVIGSPIKIDSNPKLGMVMDFGDLKTIVKKNIIDVLDHALVLNKNGDYYHFTEKSSYSDKVVMVDYQPTCENMLIDFAEKLKKELSNNTKLHSLKLRETATSFAEWYAEDN